ncbi:glycerate kinase [Abditibacterium utsteinense]|uniref:Glycerate kinase n=1 Tax=Abditibacterium utsteinense TaxID=1960156 RepID=A0A2S8STU4_9BACT|nr:glycerate kinase [Abditibacterium utsteinense]PQV64224.1 glycerate kinase [Abditibacterium utsteinense]
MKIVIAPDSFKGSLSAPQVCEALQNGARRVFPDAQFEICPLADGGEGTLDVLVQNAGGFFKTTRVQNPLGESIEAQWGILPDGRAVIEMAHASGLTLISPEKRDAKNASTFGTGQLIRAALGAGCREILVCIGGSATTDGGAGAMAALGAIFRDEHDVVLRRGGADLRRLHSIDLRFLEPKLQKAQITVLCDVSNPLCGENGAARVYGPQKGATSEDVEILDSALGNFARVCHKKCGEDFSNRSGAGAAGGLGFGLMIFCGASARSGIEVVLEAANFEERLRGADLVLTGEGALDSQTLRGKVVAGVCRAAKPQKIKVVAFGGKVDLSGAQMDELGLQSAFSLVDGPRDLNSCLEDAAPLLENAVERFFRLQL